MSEKLVRLSGNSTFTADGREERGRAIKFSSANNFLLYHFKE
jgi:hypothetical protein